MCYGRREGCGNVNRSARTGLLGRHVSTSSFQQQFSCNWMDIRRVHALIAAASLCIAQRQEEVRRDV